MSECMLSVYRPISHVVYTRLFVSVVWREVRLILESERVTYAFGNGILDVKLTRSYIHVLFNCYCLFIYTLHYNVDCICTVRVMVLLLPSPRTILVLSVIFNITKYGIQNDGNLTLLCAGAII